MFCVNCGAPEEPGLAVCRKCETPCADGAHLAFHQAVPTHPSIKLGPTNCRRRDGHVSRNCSIALLGDHISVSSGTPTVISLVEIVSYRSEESYNGEHWGGTRFLVVALRGQEIGFAMKPDYADVWMHVLSGQMPTLTR